MRKTLTESHHTDHRLNHGRWGNRDVNPKGGNPEEPQGRAEWSRTSSSAKFAKSRWVKGGGKKVNKEIEDNPSARKKNEGDV